MTTEEIEHQQIAWHSQANQGCIFATRLIKSNPPESKFKRFCFDELISSSLVEKITTITSEALKDHENFVLSFIIPSIKDKEGLIMFIDYLKNHSNWTIQDSDRFEGQKLIRIRVPFDEVDDTGRPIFAWVLGFAPLNFLPITRRSPFFEIMLVTKSKRYFKDKFNKYSMTQHHPDCMNRNTDTNDAHLADLYIKDFTDIPEKDKHLWKQSKAKKWYLLNKDGQDNDTNAKAKVTFSYPYS